MIPRTDKSLEEVLHLQLKCPLMLGKPCMAHGCMLWVWSEHSSMPVLSTTTWAYGINNPPECPEGDGWRPDGQAYYAEHNGQPCTEQKWVRDIDLKARGRCSRSKE